MVRERERERESESNDDERMLKACKLCYVSNSAHIESLEGIWRGERE